MKSKFTIWFLWILTCFSGTFAQTRPEFQLQLNKDFISWEWLGSFQWHFIPVGKTDLQISNKFNSNLYRETSQQNKWKDENVFQLKWRSPINSHLSLNSFIRSHVFSDENVFVKFSKHVVGEELEISPLPHVRITPAIGYAMEEIFSHQDQGWYTHLGLQTNKFEIGGYQNSTNALSTIRFFPGRKNQEHTIFTNWSKTFSPYASDSLRLGYQFSENRYYLRNGNDIEQVTINARFLSNQLNYRLSPGSRLTILSEFKNRDIDQTNPAFHNRRQELLIGNRIHFDGGWKGLKTRLGMIFSQNVYDNPGLQTDIDSREATLLANLMVIASPKDKFFARFAYTKYEFNTPDSLINHDDRDEQRFVIDGKYWHRFFPAFSMQIGGQIYLYHQIYIHPSRSGNNNWNRIFQLFAGFTHRLSPDIINRQRIKILANYTVYDFEEIFPEVRSFLFRKLLFNDSLFIRFTHNLSFNVIYQLEEEDNGAFYKDLFAQQITRKIRAHFINLNLVRERLWGFTLISGITYYLRDEWNFLPRKRKTRAYRSFTPRLTLAFPAGRNLIFRAAFSPTRFSDMGNVRRYSSTGNLHVQYKF